MGIHILVVAVGNWLNQLEIQSIASYPAQSNVFQVQNFSSIRTIKSLLKDAICNGTDILGVKVPRCSDFLFLTNIYLRN